MDITSGLEFISSQLTTKNLKTLSTLETTILREAWKGKEGKSYDEIGKSENFVGETVKTAAYELWKRLSKLCGEKVTKNNVQAVVERYYNRVASSSPPTSTPSTPDSVESNIAIAIPENWSHKSINFIGREKAIAHLQTLINQGAKVILIQAAGGIGKTTLATEFITQNFEKILDLTMAKEKETISPVESIVEEWLRKDFEEEPGRDFMVSLRRLKRQLQTRKIGILIDNLEPALDENGCFIEPHRQYVELLRVLADSKVQSVTLITSRERLCEPDLNFERYRLPELDLSAWQQYFQYHQINSDEPILEQMHTVYGGNAKVMRLLCVEIKADAQGNIQNYWQQNTTDILAKPDFRNLVTSQFKRLQDIEPYGFKLLCRLGCYRYQDVPTVPYNGLLCLLWDLPEGEQRRVIESLKNRSLVEFKKGEFFLHPMIREEAIARLRESEDWETANIKAAEFWTQSVKSIETVQEARVAFEAYYHYLNIGDLKSAGLVIIKQRCYQWRQNEHLGVSFYRLGLLKQIVYAIELIIDNIEFSIGLSRLYNILGDAYWMTGSIQKSIKFHNISESITTQLFQVKSQDFDIIECQMLSIVAPFNIGLCQIDLWQLEESLIYFI